MEKSEEVLNTELSVGGDHSLTPLAFARAERPSFTAEVGKSGRDLIFHFWPVQHDKYSRFMYTGIEHDPYKIEKDLENYVWVFADGFSDSLAESFLEVFKQEDRLCWDFVPEMNSWIVRAAGYGENLMKNEMANSVLDTLQKKLEG